MRFLLFVVLAVSCAEYSYQQNIIDLGAVKASVAFGLLPNKYVPLTNRDKVITAEAWNKSLPLLESKVRAHDPLLIKEATIPCGRYQLRLNNIAIHGFFGAGLQSLEVRRYLNAWDIIKEYRVDAVGFFPELTIKAKFIVVGPLVNDTNIVSGTVEGFYTGVTHDLAVSAYDVIGMWGINAEKSSYSIGNAKIKLDVDISEPLVKKFLDEHKDDILKYVTDSLRQLDKEVIQKILS